jgi:hypothetical protein
MEINEFNEFKNCDALLQFLYMCITEGIDPSNELKYAYFEGSKIEFTSDIPSIEGLFVLSSKYNKTLFIISEIYEFDNTFEISILQGDNFTWDQTITVILPKYLRNDFIAAAKGK